MVSRSSHRLTSISGFLPLFVFSPLTALRKGKGTSSVVYLPKQVFRPCLMKRCADMKCGTSF